MEHNYNTYFHDPDEYARYRISPAGKDQKGWYYNIDKWEQLMRRKKGIQDNLF